jgi:hypothetical protein
MSAVLQNVSFDQLLKELETTQARGRALLAERLRVDANIAANNDEVAQIQSKFGLNASAVPVTIPTPAIQQVAPAPKKTPTPAKKDGRNQKSLKQVIWDILNRPANANGLKTSEVLKIIETEGNWTTTGDMSSMIATQMNSLKGDGCVVRSEEKKYYIPEGAQPPAGRAPKAE